MGRRDDRTTSPDSPACRDEWSAATWTPALFVNRAQDDLQLGQPRGRFHATVANHEAVWIYCRLVLLGALGLKLRPALPFPRPCLGCALCQRGPKLWNSSGWGVMYMALTKSFRTRLLAVAEQKSRHTVSNVTAEIKM